MRHPLVDEIAFTSALRQMRDGDKGVIVDGVPRAEDRCALGVIRDDSTNFVLPLSGDLR